MSDIIPIKGGRGAKTKLTPDKIALIAKKLNRENDLPQLAAVVGVTTQTIRNWLKRGRDGEEPFASLYAAVMREQHDYIEELHRQGDTYAAMNNSAGVKWVQYKLSKSFRAYGDKQHADETDDTEDLSGLSTHDLVTRAKRIIGGDVIDTTGSGDG